MSTARRPTRGADPAADSLSRWSTDLHAELVAVGVCHHDPADLALADVESGRPERDQAVDLRSLVTVARGSEVEVQPVLPGVLAGSDRRVERVGAAMQDVCCVMANVLAVGVSGWCRARPSGECVDVGGEPVEAGGPALAGLGSHVGIGYALLVGDDLGKSPATVDEGHGGEHPGVDLTP